MGFDEENSSKIDELSLKLLEIIYEIVPWGEIGITGRDKWRVLAKRVMVAKGEDFQEFLHNVVREIAGDRFYYTTTKEGNIIYLGREIEELTKEADTQDIQKKVIEYLKSRAIPLVIRLSAKLAQEGKEGE